MGVVNRVRVVNAQMDTCSSFVARREYRVSWLSAGDAAAHTMHASSLLEAVGRKPTCEGADL